MRISDWSSDVCSSDLVHNGASRAPFQYRLLAGVRRQHLLDPQGLGHVLSADPAVYFLIIPVDMLLLGTKHDTGKLALFIGALNTSIGRASCRERGCQYVNISGLAGEFTKKKKKNQQ